MRFRAMAMAKARVRVRVRVGAHLADLGHRVLVGAVEEPHALVARLGLGIG